MLGPVTGYMLLASSVRAQVENFDEALKNTLLAHHQRHVPQVIVKGSEVTLVYAPDMEWTKSAAHDDVAKMDALDCLKADYEFNLHNPTHRLHDYFRVVEYSSWSKQVVGEATARRSKGSDRGRG